jgi:hypothetical protein
LSATYCVDTSSFSELTHFRRDILPSFWDKIEVLAGAKSLIAPREVLRELEKRYPELAEWLKRLDISVELDDSQVQWVRRIRAKFVLTDVEAVDPSADEILVALALSLRERARPELFTDLEFLVVTEESKGGRGAAKIRNVCEEFGIECIALADLFAREGLRY